MMRDDRPGYAIAARCSRGNVWKSFGTTFSRDLANIPDSYHGYVIERL